MKVFTALLEAVYTAMLVYSIAMVWAFIYSYYWGIHI